VQTAYFDPPDAMLVLDTRPALCEFASSQLRLASRPAQERLRTEHVLQAAEVPLAISRRPDSVAEIEAAVSEFVIERLSAGAEHEPMFAVPKEPLQASISVRVGSSSVS
jgi:hypothetical protein